MSSPVNSKWRAAAIILAVILLPLGTNLFRIQSDLKNVFHYDVTVTFKNKDTGQILESVTTHGPETSSSDLFHQSTTYRGSPVNPRFSGIAYKPRKFEFSLEGYSSEKVMITDRSPSELTIELQRQSKP